MARRKATARSYWEQAIAFSLAFLILATAVPKTTTRLVYAEPLRGPAAAHGSHTLNLHATDVTVGGATYNTADESALAGALITASADISDRNLTVDFTDGASIAVFASDPVPSGATWDISGSWTLNPYVRTTVDTRIYMRARIHVIDANGAITQTFNFNNGTRYDTTSSYQLLNWNVTVPGGTVLQAGERFGVRFRVQPDGDELGENAILGFDDAVAPSNVVAQIVETQPGNVREAHFRVGEDSPLTASTWYASTDTPMSGLVRDTNFRVRFQLYNNGDTNVSWTPQLEWTTTPGSGYAAVPTASGASPFFVSDTTQYTSGATIATGNFALGAGTGTAQSGVAYDTENPASAGITLNADSYTEVDFSVQANANATAGATYYFRITSAGTALTAYDSSDAQVAIQAETGVIREAHYRIGQDSVHSSMTWYAATDTIGTGIQKNTNFRVRFQLYNNGPSSAAWVPQLEWTATPGSGYAVVPTVSGAAPFFVSDTVHFASAATIATTDFGMGVGTGSAQPGVAYDSENPANVGITLNANSYTEIEFDIQANANAGDGATYGFRLTNSSTPLTAYETSDAQITIFLAVGYVRSDHYRIGQDTALSSMLWYSSTDTPATAFPRDTNARVRFQVYNDGAAAATWTPQLDWSNQIASGYSAVPTSSGADPFFIVDTAWYVDAASISTGSFGLGNGVGTASVGTAYDAANPAVVSINLDAGAYTEIEFSFQTNSNAAEGGSYYFRLTDAGTLLTAYEHAAAEVIVQTAPPPIPTAVPPAHNFHLPYASDTSACAACHRVHTSPAPTAIQKQWPEEQVCFTCHDGTGAPNVMSQFAKTYAMPISMTSGLHTLGEARLHDPAAFNGANRHVECTDCHNPHSAGFGNHTIGSAYAFGPQQGVWGVLPSYTSSWTAPSTWTPVDQITYQYELCFKCHSSWAYDGSPPISPSGGFLQTDVAKDFNPLNASYMPVVAQGKNPFQLSDGTSYASSLIGGFTPTSRMVCTDCHMSETPGDPAGPHGSTNPYILSGAWDRTTGRMPGQKVGGGPDTSDHLCFTCHDVNVYANPANGGSPWDQRTGFSGGGTNFHAMMVGARNKSYNDNAIVCMDCHVAVTHGYFRDHLIGFTNDPAPYIDRPYSGGLTTIDTWQQSGQWTFDSCATAMGNCK